MEFTRRGEVSKTTRNHDEHSRGQSRQVSNSASAREHLSSAPEPKKLETEEAKLNLEFQQVRAQLLMCPEKHPDYSTEWHKFWNKRSSVVRSLGGDPNTYDYTPEWKELWGKRMDELLQIQYTTILEEIRLKFSQNSHAKVSPTQPIPSPEAHTELVPVQEVRTESPLPVDTKPNLIQVLDILTRLEDQLGSLTPQVLQFFRMAEDMESSVAGGSHLLLKSRDFLALLTTCKSKLLEKMQTDILPPDILSVINVNIYNLSKILQFSQNQPVRRDVQSNNDTHNRTKISQVEIHPSSTRTTLTSSGPEPPLHGQVSSVWSNSLDRLRTESDNRSTNKDSRVIDYNHEIEGRQSQRTLGVSLLQQNTSTPLTSTSACLSDQDWVDFFTLKEPVSAPKLDRGLLEFISSQPQTQPIKSCLRVGHPEPHPKTDLNYEGLPPPKKSCLRPSSSTARRPDTPESLSTSNQEPCTQLVETWRKVIVGRRSPSDTKRSESRRSESSRSESSRHESSRSESKRYESIRSESKRSQSSRSESRRGESSRSDSKRREESSSSESRRKESSRSDPKRSESKRIESKTAKERSPLPLFSISLATARPSISKSYDRGLRAQEFLSDSEETKPCSTKDTNSQPAKSSDPPKKWVKSFTDSGDAPPAPKEFSVLSLIKGRDWYRQYLNTTEGKSENTSKPSSTSTRVSESRGKMTTTRPSSSSTTTKTSTTTTKTAVNREKTSKPSSNSTWNKVEKTAKPTSNPTQVSRNMEKQPNKLNSNTSNISVYRSEPTRLSSSSATPKVTQVSRNLEKPNKSYSTTARVSFNRDKATTVTSSSAAPKIAAIILPVNKPVIQEVVTIIDDDDTEPPPPGVSPEPELPSTSTSTSTAPKSFVPGYRLELKLQPGEEISRGMDVRNHRCKKCAKYGHFEINCLNPPRRRPLEKMKCLNCKEKGHLVKDCTKPRVIHLKGEKEENT